MTSIFWQIRFFLNLQSANRLWCRTSYFCWHSRFLFIRQGMNQCENYLCQVVKTSPSYGKDVYGRLSGVTVCIIEWNYREVDFEVESQGNFARFLVEYKLISSVDIVKEHSEKSNVSKDTSHSFFWIASVISSSIKESSRYPNWKADWRPFWVDSCHNKKLNHDKRKIFQGVLMSTLKIICLWSFIAK